jgi:hypothetical protein
MLLMLDTTTVKCLDKGFITLQGYEHIPEGLTLFFSARVPTSLLLSFAARGILLKNYKITSESYIPESFEDTKPLTWDTQTSFKESLIFQQAECYKLYEEAKFQGIAPRHASLFLPLNTYIDATIEVTSELLREDFTPQSREFNLYIKAIRQLASLYRLS